MSMSTKSRPGAPKLSARALEKEGSDKQNKSNRMREDFSEKKPEQKKSVNINVPTSTKYDWWTPDPITGVYVPEHYHGCVTTAPRETVRTSSGGSGASHVRSETDLGKDQGPWFNSME
uniref:Uncharacterized protein n=2 Tax=Physcomitrium patens TaxID=3218 RepID=A0A2K1JIM0_PHYPA|nr:hypothetical protein PHYPA_018801 [Physcomitrium patens]